MFIDYISAFVDKQVSVYLINGARLDGILLHVGQDYIKLSGKITDYGDNILPLHAVICITA